MNMFQVVKRDGEIDEFKIGKRKFTVRICSTFWDCGLLPISRIRFRMARSLWKKFRTVWKMY